MADPVAPAAPGALLAPGSQMAPGAQLAPGATTGEQQLPHDIRGLVPYRGSLLDYWPYAAGLLALLLALAGFLWWRRRRAALRPPAPPADPWDVLAGKLAQLTVPRPFGLQEQAEYFFHLSLLLREAIELRTGLRATDLTLGELKAPLRNKLPLPTGDVDGVLAFLERADYVKFAGRPASTEEAVSAREQATTWARRLRPLVEATA